MRGTLVMVLLAGAAAAAAAAPPTPAAPAPTAPAAAIPPKAPAAPGAQPAKAPAAPAAAAPATQPARTPTAPAAAPGTQPAKAPAAPTPAAASASQATAPVAPALVFPVPKPEPKADPTRPKPHAYLPPKIDAEPTPGPSDVASVEIPAQGDVPIQLRPVAGSPMLGAGYPGARLPVRGLWEAPSNRGCSTKRWYALVPEGWVCSTWVKQSTAKPTADPVLKVREGEVVPYRYVMIGFKTEADSLPMWASLDDLKSGAQPLTQLHKGDTVAVKDGPTVKVGDTSYFVAEDGRVFPAHKAAFTMRNFSTWQGVRLDEQTTLPLAWVTPDKARVYDAPSMTARAVDTVARRTRLPILDEAGTGKLRFVRVGDGRWMRASDVNEARLLPRPELARGNDHWIDVDLGEQVLVAYEGDRPVFATLVSAGRSMPTPRGDYPVWAKVSQITMKSQPYEDHTYYVDRVPWSLFFQAHNAIHGAYWHDRFGVSKSHGCVNTAPKDARWLFEWLPPSLPAGWSGTRTPNLLEGPVVHVRNSHLKIPIEQERPIGPPDREDEKWKRELADARRLAAAQAAAATTAGTPASPSGDPAAPAGPPPSVVTPSADPR